MEITILELAPKYIGRGLGGALLTLASRLAWRLTDADDLPPRRVWLHTSALDHPGALAN